MRDHRTDYEALAGNIASRHEVCIAFMPADYAAKLCLLLAVLLVYVPAGWASPAGVARIDKKNGDPFQLRLVFNESAKLTEGPIVQPFPLLLAGLSVLQNTLQVFKGNRKAQAFCIGNDGFGNTVVLVLLEKALLISNLFKAALGRLGSYLLKGSAPRGVAFPVGLNLGSGILVSSVVSGNVDYTHVDAKDATGKHGVNVGNIAGGGNVPLSTHEHQVNLAFLALEQFCLFRSTAIPHLLAATKNPDGNPSFGHEPKRARVERLGCKWTELILLVLVGAIGIGHLVNASAGALACQTESFAGLMVIGAVHIELAKCLRLPGLLRNPIATLIGAFKSFKKGFSLSFSWQKLHGNNYFHKEIIA